MRSIARRFSLAALLLAAQAATASAQDVDASRRTLVGLQGMQVGIEALKPELERLGLARTTLQTDVELRLRVAGLKVLSPDQRLDAPGRPILYVQVSAMTVQVADGLYGYTVKVALLQDVRLNRDSTIATVATTWDSGPILGLVGEDNLANHVRGVVRDAVDKFANAFLAANPK